MWPALSSYIIAGVAKLTSNVLTSYFLLEVITIILFLWSFFKLLIMQSKEVWIRYFFIFFCLGATFHIKIVSIDLQCLSISTFTIYLLAKQKYLEDKNTLFWVCISGILGLTCLFRFNFYAVAFTPAITLGLYWVFHKNPIHLRLALTTCILPAVFILGQSFYIKQHSADMAFIQSYHISPYWTNITLIKPVLTTLIFNVDTNIIDKFLVDYYPSLSSYLIILSVNIILSLFEFTFILWVFYKIFHKIKADILHLFLVMLIAVLFLSLYTLSLFMEPLSPTV